MIVDTLTPRIERLDDGTDPRYGQFIIEPLERGYGTTLGNALRRVLLSSIPGAAITFVTIEGVLHEFSTVPGVVEDTTEIMLNLKELAIRVLESPEGPGMVQPPTEGPRILRIERTGPGEVLGADVEGPSDVEIINKDLHIVRGNQAINCRGDRVSWISDEDFPRHVSRVLCPGMFNSPPEVA